jgi:hypothetical protein
MPLVFQEKISKKMENGDKAHFCLKAHSDDFGDSDEGCYNCQIRVLNPDGKVTGDYYRRFLMSKFRIQHYHQFVEKFCKDEEYREQFNVLHYKTDSVISHDIDMEIRHIILRLNDLGLKTTHSCCGTKTPFSDRPHVSDGHSVLGYIIFQHKIPQKFLDIVSRYDMFLSFNSHSVTTLKRKYNVHFRELLEKIVEEYDSSAKVGS